MMLKYVFSSVQYRLMANGKRKSRESSVIEKQKKNNIELLCIFF